MALAVLDVRDHVPAGPATARAAYRSALGYQLGVTAHVVDSAALITLGRQLNTPAVIIDVHTGPDVAAVVVERNLIRLRLRAAVHLVGGDLDDWRPGRPAAASGSPPCWL
jgi:hypothetical protein